MKILTVASGYQFLGETIILVLSEHYWERTSSVQPSGWGWLFFFFLPVHFLSIVRSHVSSGFIPCEGTHHCVSAAMFTYSFYFGLQLHLLTFFPKPSTLSFISSSFFRKVVPTFLLYHRARDLPLIFFVEFLLTHQFLVEMSFSVMYFSSSVCKCSFHVTLFAIFSYELLCSSDESLSPSHLSQLHLEIKHVYFVYLWWSQNPVQFWA